MARPNVIFILMDDLGWRDLGCTGSDFYETPNLDRLRAEGMQFENGYAACPVCSPSRASIMSGKYPARVGVTDWICWNKGGHPCRGKVIDAPYIDHLPSAETSLATALRDGGYRTWHVGKWHLGGPDYYPDKHGFEVNIGGCHIGCPYKGYFAPWGIDTLPDAPEGTYLPDHLTDEAIRLIRENDGTPFFLNLWYYLVHTPIQAKQEDIDYFTAKAERLGLDQKAALVEGDFHPGEHKKNVRIVRRMFQSDPVYAAMVKSMDDNIGRVLAALEEEGLAENTAVFFTGDNGGLATSEGSPTCNLPLIEGKGWMYEGGTREALLCRWPGVVAPGSSCAEPVTSPDFYPTILELAGLPARPEQHVDGVSILPLLKGEAHLDREAIFWHYPHYGNQGGTPGASVRAGDWKLIKFWEDGSLELYNLAEDQGEQHNLAEAEPEKREELRSRLEAWLADVEAKIPQPNPDFVPWLEADLGTTGQP